MSNNLEAVNKIYAAFGQGDTDAILALMDEDVRWAEWADNLAQRAGVPWLLPRRGRAGVAEFFQIVATFEIREFRVLSLLAGGNQVAAEVIIDAVVPSTGGSYRDEEMHLWTFGDNGKIVRMRHYVDTAKHIRAAAGP